MLAAIHVIKAMININLPLQYINTYVYHVPLDGTTAAPIDSKY